VKPIRIQRKRTRGFRLPPNTVCVNRPTRYGNPFVVGTYQKHPLAHLGSVLVRDSHHAQVLFKEWLVVTAEGQKLARRAKDQLRSKNIACFCGLDDDCHGDVLLELANPEGAA
jgi:Domain of unknown function (DUF4326)